MSRVTYDAGNLTIEVDGLDTVAAALGDLKKKTPAAAKVAINATARQARKEVGGQAVLGRQIGTTTPWPTERHGYDPTSRRRPR